MWKNLVGQIGITEFITCNIKNKLDLIQLFGGTSMKKKACIIFLITLCFVFTSCIDYVQAISYKNGKYQFYYKITLSKLLFAMADEDPEEIFRNFDEESLGEVPKNVSINPVNTDIEVGGEFKFTIDPKTTDETEKTYLPTAAGNKCYIPFLLGENKSIADSIGSDAEDSFAIAILSSAKCRILINKGIISSIETAYFEGKGNQNYSIPIYDYGENLCLEIPFIVLSQNGMYRTDRVVVIRN